MYPTLLNVPESLFSVRTDTFDFQKNSFEVQTSRSSVLGEIYNRLREPCRGEAPNMIKNHYLKHFD